jgi:hypothetical protein
VEERYLSQIEQSRMAKPLPIEVLENVQEAIWAGVSGSVKTVLHRLVDLALADEATEAGGRRTSRANTRTMGPPQRHLHEGPAHVGGQSRMSRCPGSGCRMDRLREDGPPSTATGGGPTSSTG